MKKSKADYIFAKVIQQFKVLRTAQGISHEGLARKSGVTRPAISYIESGKRKPSLLVALRIAYALDQNLSDIVRHAENCKKVK